MTIDHTPMNPDDNGKREGQCSAWGCPMWAGIKIAGDWVCAQHAFASADDYQAVTQRLRQRMPLIRTLHRAMHTDPFAFEREGTHLAAADRMRKIQRPDLAPMTVRLAHPYRDRHTGETVERVIERDESQHVKLWAQRMQSALFRECTAEIPEAQQPETVAMATGPQSVSGFLPQFAEAVV